MGFVLCYTFIIHIYTHLTLNKSITILGILIKTNIIVNFCTLRWSSEHMWCSYIIGDLKVVRHIRQKGIKNRFMARCVSVRLCAWRVVRWLRRHTRQKVVRGARSAPAAASSSRWAPRCATRMRSSCALWRRATALIAALCLLDVKCLV